MTTMHERHLAQAKRHIVEAEGRVTRQRLLVERLETGGHDPAGAEELLAMMLACLDGMLAHRELILAELAAERGQPPPP